MSSSGSTCGDSTSAIGRNTRGSLNSARRAYHGPVVTPPSGDTWTGLMTNVLPLDVVSRWAVLPSCGAVVVFSGTARDHSKGRDGVDLLEYEAYEEQVEPRLEALAATMRQKWPEIGRLAMIHRIGVIPVTESAVVVAVSSPHRGAAFEAASYGIDTLKRTIPIWKKERWAGGESWGLEPQHIAEIEKLEVEGP